MKLELRRYVWVIDLIGMLVGAAMVGHLVANQIVSMWWPRAPSESAPTASRPGRPPGGAPAVAAVLFPHRARCSAAPERIGSHHDEISRALFDEIVDHVGRRHPTRLVPVTADDRPLGVRIFGDSDGLTGAIGLASGDLVLEVNGFPLTHPDAVLNAYLALRQTREPWLVIERAGHRILLTYSIVDRPRVLRALAPGWSTRSSPSLSP
jgi:hypothetical protein